MTKKFGLILILISAFQYFVFSQNNMDARLLINTDTLLMASDSLHTQKQILDEYKALSENFEVSGNLKKALFYYKKYSDLEDFLQSEKFLKQILEIETKYEAENKSNKLTLQQVENEKFQSDKKWRALVIIFLITVFAGVIIFSVLIYFWLVNKNKANILHQVRNDEIKVLEDKLARKSKLTSDTIHFANIIQSAILTPNHLFREYFPEHFIFFKPKYVVGGDFYWLTNKGSKIVVAVADCTGHGMSGALMSMLGIDCLNNIINKSSLEYSDEILNQLKERLTQSLLQDDETAESKYGMDIAICIIDLDKMEAQYSGAYSSLYYISNNNLEVLRADRIPIGFSTRNDVYFTRKNFKLNKGDIIYMFTDGYCDQFGGENKKKFMSKRFSHLLLDIYQFSMDKQKEWLGKTLSDWMKDNIQVDDITVLGIKI